MRNDKTWSVHIRFTHNNKTRYIPTTMYITKKDITSSYKIKNGAVLKPSCKPILLSTQFHKPI